MLQNINTRVVCDRCCCTVVDGCETIEDGHIVATGGYYKRAGWAAYMDYTESIICDICMHSDPRYQKVYGPGAR